MQRGEGGEHWKTCGYWTKTKALRVVLGEQNRDGDAERVKVVLVTMKDLEPNEAREGGPVEETEVDPYFFDDGYTLAATTGFARVWEGAEAMTRWLTRTRAAGRGTRVCELGAGVGECGLVLAALGCHVVLTDVRAVVEDVIRRNIAQNGEGTETRGEAWPNALAMGDGSASRATLDWTDPVPARPFGKDCEVTFFDADVLIAAECVWLRELLAPFVSTTSTLLRGGVEKLLLSVRDRSSSEDPSSGKAFANTKEVIRAFENAGCVVETLHREESTEDEGKDIVILDIRAVSRG